MRRCATGGLLAATFALTAPDADAQMARTPAPGAERAPVDAAPRDPRFPYAGLWRGTRRMPVGEDEIGLRFSVTDGRYAGITLHPGGGTAPHHRLTATAAGLTWEQPNSGGGTWVFLVRLVAPDSLAGTLELRDPPPALTPAPRGTIGLARRTAPVRDR